MTLITSADYPSIRAAIDITLDATTLPDSVIALDLYTGRAEREVISRIPTASAIATGTSDDAFRIALAVVLLAASYIAPAIPAITAQTFGAAIYERSVDWNERAQTLRAQAETEMQTVIANQSVSTNANTSRYTMFTVASV